MHVFIAYTVLGLRVFSYINGITPYRFYVFKLYINGIVVCILMQLSLLSTFWINVNVLLFRAVQLSTVRIHLNRCLCFSASGYLGCFQFLAVTHNAARSIPLQVS